METFEFSVETKHTIWYKTFVNVEANSLEEAIKKAQELGSGLEDYAHYSEMMIDTIEYLPVDENGGQPTEEIRCLETDKIIWNNVEGNQ